MNQAASLQWLPKGPLIVLGDSYSDGAGNYSYLSSGIVTPNQFCDGPCLGMYLGRICRQAGTLVGRYTPAGALSDPSVPGLLAGRNYACAGSELTNNIIAYPTYPGLNDQITKLLADYPNGLPNGTVVWLALTFINDVLAVLSGQGGQWTPGPTTSWTISGLQTIPNATTTWTINVVSSTGATAGVNNQIAIPLTVGGYYLNGGGVYPAITGVAAGTISVNQNNVAANGFTIPANGIILTGAQAQIQGEITSFITKLNSLVSIVSAANGMVILMSPVNVGYLPLEQANATLANNTSAMVASLVQAQLTPFTQKYVRLLDMQPYYSAVVAAPSKYGFKDAISYWNQSSTTNPNDYLWWDQQHNTYAGYKGYIWDDVLPKFHKWGLVEYVN